MPDQTAASPTARSDECFLCADAERCDVPRVEGSLVGARLVDRNGAPDPIVGLRLAGGEQAVVHLGKEQRRLVGQLVALPPDQLKALALRALHVTARPAQATHQIFAALPRTLVIVEPDRLLNITDLNNAAYCVRHDLLRSLRPSPPSAASVRGTLIHNIFKELLKNPDARPDDLLATYLSAQVQQLAEVGATEGEIAAETAPHVASLDAWQRHLRHDLWGDHAPEVRAETFLLAPEIGLKGRLDIMLTDKDGSSLIELKTGRVTGDLPREQHRWQVQGYHALLAVRGHGPHRATLLYSATPGQASGYGVPPRPKDMQRVIDLRNTIAVVRATGVVPPAPGGNRCAKCYQRVECAEMSHLLGWTPPPGDPPPTHDAGDAAWFRHWHDLQQTESRAAEAESRKLWREPVATRIVAGKAIAGLTLAEPPRETERHEWQYRLFCENTSELREGDEVLISDGDPVRGAVVSGTILRIESGEVTVWAREYIAHPALIDRYSAEVVDRRMLNNLARWLRVEERLRALVRGDQRPRFAHSDLPVHPDALAGLNQEQAQAVLRAMTAQDYLLIQGPPGTGKTKVIGSIARALLSRGYRVALGAFTNQATDTMFARLVESGVTHGVRLGHEFAVDEHLRPYRLLRQAASLTDGAPPKADDVRAALRSARLVAATAAMWSAETFEVERTMPLFDVAIIDEASQLTVPAIVGPLRWARRFILVGDQHQLPPLVQHPPARDAGLGASLFESLLATAPDQARITLHRQYRMNEAIGAWPSRQFYGGRLVADKNNASATLDIAPVAHHDALDPARPLVWVEVPPDARAQPKLNDAEARAAALLARALADSGLDPAEIGIIAPFRAQVARIRQHAGDLIARGATIDTVDRFQGGERRVILLSLVAATPPVPDSQHATFLSDPRRLNVALTRARHKLIILGWRPAFADLPLVRDLADHCASFPGGLVRWSD